MAFLSSEGKTQTTAAIHLRHLRAILNEARRQGIVKEAQYPFGRGRFEIQEGEGRKMALTLVQIGQIARYDDGSDATAKYRDYWLFLYLCNGINVADFVRLRYRDIVNGEICFVRQKTARTTRTRKEIRVIVTDRMQAIIDRWGKSSGSGSVHLSGIGRVGGCDAAEIENTVFDAGDQQTNDDNRRSSRNR